MTRRLLAGLALLAAIGIPPASGAELRARGLLDLVLSSGDDAQDWNKLTQGDSNFDPYRLRLFVDAAVAPQIDVFAQTILHEGTAKIVADGAYAQWTPWSGRDAHLQAGKIPWPIGTWGPRTYSDRNPLIGMPLMYQYHTDLPWAVPTASVDALVANAGMGQTDVAYGTGAASTGMAVVDDRWWDVGVVAIGSQRPFEYAIGETQGTPGWPLDGSDETPGSTTLGRLGLAPVAGVRVGVSGAYGTWMPDWFARTLPAGGSLRDYHESLGMADLELERGPWELRGEGFLKAWQTIHAGTLRLNGGYGEARLGLGEGYWIAGRYDVLRFDDVTTSAGVTRPWDDGVDRLELGGGYRVSRDVRLKASFQRDVRHPFQAKDLPVDLFALATSIRF